MTGEKKSLFESAPVGEAILRLALPSVLTQIVLVIYNMADTFFIGMTGRDELVTAVTVSMPAFMFLSAIANLFGVGGSSTISRALGKDDRARAGSASGISLAGCVLLTLSYSLSAYIFREPFLRALGAGHVMVRGYAGQYILVTVVFGGLAASLSTLFSFLIRAEGRPVHASAGMMGGAVLNILLDPLFMFVILPPGQEVLGVALATLTSNLASLAYYLAEIRKNRREGRTALTFRVEPGAWKGGILREILETGAPACMMTLLENISYAVLDSLIAGAGLMYQSGIGVAKKVNMMAHSIVRGMTQGVLPLTAYNYANGNYARTKQILRASMMVSVGFSLAATASCLLFSHELIGIFLGSSPSAAYGAKYLRILCLGCPFSAFAYSVISFFQAIGRGKSSFVLAVLRKGVVDIPLMYVLSAYWPVYGAAWATPAADLVCCITAGNLLMECAHQLKSAEKSSTLQVMKEDLGNA